jgi:hypothetical protein
LKRRGPQSKGWSLSGISAAIDMPISPSFARISRGEPCLAQDSGSACLLQLHDGTMLSGEVVSPNPSLRKPFQVIAIRS